MKTTPTLAILTLGVMMLIDLNSHAKSILAKTDGTFLLTLCRQDYEKPPLVSKSLPLKPGKDRTRSLFPTITVRWDLTIAAGHSAADCKGVGESCYQSIVGVWIPCHVPCWGGGSSCSHTFSFSVTIKPAFKEKQPEHDGTIDTSLDGFNDEVLNMPARSIKVDSEYGKYINIPRQISAKIDGDKSSFLYSVKGVTFSDQPKYSNE